MQQDLWSHWKQPEVNPNSYVTGLHVNNSLRPGTLIPFIPHQGKLVKFYYCGPTVYSYSHLGHAKTYINIDILKRIMRDYFGYDMFTVMNITDIDDKIIEASKKESVDFLQITKKWEKDFFDQMDALNVELPDGITRVSEYVDDIVIFIAKIIDHGYAYESNGSVYFNVEKYTADGFTYCKLEPFNRNNTAKQAEGEGSSQVGLEGDKKSNQDFALWKNSKPGEPTWNSPWGQGRPGWHIECSVMAHDMLGSPIDLHLGGVDLRFPHHDNSIAQTESFLKCDQWINYFIHTGHLNITGQKMSKSLKNFLTIQEILNRYTCRQIRLIFSIHLHDTTMNYSEDSMLESIQKDQTFAQFFMSIKATIRCAQLTSIQRWKQAELDLNATLLKTKAKVHEHFCNNFNVPAAIKEIENLITSTNVYMKVQNPQKPILVTVMKYVGNFMDIIGLQYQKQDESHEDKIVPLMDVLCKFRDQVKKQAKDKDFKAIFETCDLVRDDDLLQLGIKLEDRAIGEPSIWKQSSPSELLQERELKAQLRKKIQDEKIQKENIALKKEIQRIESMKVKANQLFINDKQYTLFDENGIPTHDKDGKELSKKQQKYVKQKWDEQLKLNEEYEIKQMQL